jgi:ABC-type sugar transport system ATPase subunit
MAGEDVVVSMENISKRFGEVVALDNVDLTLREGEIFGLVGDNGAGKSTLIKCLAGAHTPTSGTIEIRGEPVEIENPRIAKEFGIETTFQDLALAGNLTVTQNIFLGREEMIGTNRVFGLLDKSKMRNRTETLLTDLEIDVDPSAQVSDLSGGQRQLVAISRMLLTDPDIVIMDEPTSALSVEGADRVLELIQQLKDRGISIIYISHNLEYLQQIADRLMILYQGKNAGVVDAQATSRDEIVSRMVAGHQDKDREQQTA